MIQSLGRFILLVHDYDDAKRFYCDTLGFETIYDSPAPGGGRFLHLGVPGQPGVPPVGLWLMQAHTDEQKERVGNQTGGEPVGVMYTRDCRAAHAEMVERGVRFVIEPREEEGAVFAHFLDLYGNEYVLVELKA